jgi:hypothetical protein
MPKSVWWSDG